MPPSRRVPRIAATSSLRVGVVLGPLLGLLLGFGLTLCLAASRTAAEEAPDPAVGRPPFPLYLGLPVEPVRGVTRVEGAHASVVLPHALQGDVVQHAFVVTNDGPAPMQLSRVKACEGCILEGYAREIAPGRSGRIEVLILTDSLGGQTVHGTVRAETSDPQRPVLDIEATLPVDEFARVEPYRVWLTGTAGEKVVARCLIVPNEAYPFEITGIKTRKGTWFELSRAATTFEGRPAWEITLTNTRTRPGPYQDVLYVQTTHPRRPELKVRVEGRIEPSP